MDKFEKFKIFLSGKPWYIKLLVLILFGVFVYFSSGCSYKFHADHIDNVTRELSISTS